MRKSRYLLALPLAVATILVPSLNAYAASDPCNLGGVSVALYLSNAPSLAIQARGTGSQVRIENNSTSTFTFHDHDINGTTYVTIVDASGKCLKEYPNQQVVIGGGNCDISKRSNYWKDVFDASVKQCEFQNGTGVGGSNDWLITTNDKAGNKVWGGHKSGNWYHWLNFTTGNRVMR